jgi:hypothetical protein
MAYYMEATKWIVGKGPKAKVQKDEFSELRKPFENEQLAVVDNLSVETIPGKEKLYALAAEVGMLSTLRWKPRMVRQKLNIAEDPYLCVVNDALTEMYNSPTSSRPRVSRPS